MVTAEVPLSDETSGCETVLSGAAVGGLRRTLPLQRSCYIGLGSYERFNPFKEQCCQPNMKPSLYSSGGSWWWFSGVSGGNVGCIVVWSVLDCWTGVVLICSVHSVDCISGTHLFMSQCDEELEQNSRTVLGPDPRTVLGPEGAMMIC
jgi:hypothetical protein